MNNEFIWGCASAAAQIEGGAYDDGKGLSIWDAHGKFHRIFKDQNGDVACDSYHRYKEDVALLKELGVKAYRFSISWPRIIPNGYDKKINPKGIEYYNNLINELLVAGITPYISVFHWDLPYEIYLRGGWLNPEISEWFAFYSKVIAENFGDRVKHFIPVNEPECVIGGLGGTDPDNHYSNKELLTMVHNLLLCYGKCVLELRKIKDVNIGIGLCGNGSVPKTDSKEDLEAAYKSFFNTGKGNPWSVSLFGDPIILGKYPDDYYKLYSKDELPDIGEHDMEIIHQVPDFVGFNNYTSTLVEADKSSPLGYKELNWGPDMMYTRGGTWPVVPEGLYYLIKFLNKKYNLPIVITENGTPCYELVTEDKRVHDGFRVEFLNRYIKAVLKAKEEGVDIRGYFVWSILDNLEWYSGYNERFGLVHVNFETLERTKKDSFYFYQNVIKSTKF